MILYAFTFCVNSSFIYICNKTRINHIICQGGTPDLALIQPRSSTSQTTSHCILANQDGHSVLFLVGKRLWAALSLGVNILIKLLI